MTMRLNKVLVALLVVFGIAGTSVGDDAKGKKTDLEGTWKAVKKDSAVQMLKFTGNRFEATIGGNVYSGTFELQNDENPLQIDMKIIKTPVEKHQGKTTLGIYDFQGAHLRWCASQPGRKRRPSQFAKLMGDARLILGTFKKAK